jgi:ATP-dependent RNA helicase DeaD
VEQDAGERKTSGVTRGQNVLYVLPQDRAAVAQFLAPALERVDPATAELQLLVVASDDESAAWIAGVAARLGAERGIVAVPATSARRALRLLRARPAHVVAGTPAELLALSQGAALKLESLRALVIAWADTLLESGGDQSLETLLADAPREAARSLVASELTPAVETLVERYARRARRVLPEGAEDAHTPPLDVEFAVASSGGRTAAVRRLLDELDPAGAAIYVRSDESEAEVEATLHDLGYGTDLGVRVVREAPAGEVDMVVLFDLPASAQELRALAGDTPRRVVALVTPRQIGAVRALAKGGEVKPLSFPEAPARARQREESLRSELRAVLEGAGFARELIAVEPLLADYDGSEIAAAAVRLLEEAREALKRAAATARSVAAASGAGGGDMARLWINVGAKEGVRPGDLVGVIANEGGVKGGQVGRVDIRESFSIVEVEAAVAEQVVQKIGGTQLRGRRVQARVDQGPSGGRERPSGGRERSGPRERPSGGARGERPSRPRSDGDRPSRPRSDGDRPARPRSFDRGERSERPERGERPARPRSGFSERPDRGERSERPARPRTGGFDRPRSAPPRGAAPRRPRRDDA